MRKARAAGRKGARGKAKAAKKLTRKTAMVAKGRKAVARKPAAPRPAAAKPAPRPPVVPVGPVGVGEGVPGGLPLPDPQQRIPGLDKPT